MGEYRTIPTRLIVVNGYLSLSCRYDAGLVAAIKNLPDSDRWFDYPNKAWLIAPAHVDEVVSIIAQYLGEVVAEPTLSNTIARPSIQSYKLEYLGQLKDRGNGNLSAFGYADSQWCLIFSEQVLRAYFDVVDDDEPSRPAQQQTYYNALGIPKKATSEEIKEAHRRLAKQWHPDICKEPDAGDQFRRIQEAYEVLSDPQSRKKYNAALKFCSQSEQSTTLIQQNWRSPLRCGYVLVEGVEQLGRFVISKILAWEDVIDERGRTMTSYFDVDLEKVVVQWV